MNLTEYIGLMAGLLITGSFIPQLIRVFQLKSAREISLLFTSLLLIGMLCWLTYGIRLGLTQVILWNVIGAFLVMILLYAKMKYGR